MNKVVRHHYPASKLPAELRGGIAPDKNVTVTIVEDDETGNRVSLDDVFKLRRINLRSPEEIDAAIRNIRNELND